MIIETVMNIYLLFAIDFYQFFRKQFCFSCNLIAENIIFQPTICKS